jgi:hypothetical protein
LVLSLGKVRSADRDLQTFGTTNGPAVIAKIATPSTFGRLMHQDRTNYFCSKTKSQTRCNIKKDAGLTRANMTGMKYYCLFFSRGCCPYGWECEYLHLLPDPSITALPDNSKDCFARDKFADYRDDMGGVGSFQRINRTLYIGRIKEVGTGPETEAMVRRHFREWGEITHSTVFHNDPCVNRLTFLAVQFAFSNTEASHL